MSDADAGVNVQIELQLSDVKRLENHEAVAFGDIEITMSGAAARYLHTDTDPENPNLRDPEHGKASPIDAETWGAGE